MPSRRFAPPRSVEGGETYFVVKDHDGQQLAYVYFENEPGRRSAAKLLTKNEARRIAANIAKLPEQQAQSVPPASRAQFQMAIPPFSDIGRPTSLTEPPSRFPLTW
jgi:hypothetical protein